MKMYIHSEQKGPWWNQQTPWTWKIKWDLVKQNNEVLAFGIKVTQVGKVGGDEVPHAE